MLANTGSGLRSNYGSAVDISSSSEEDGYKAAIASSSSEEDGNENLHISDSRQTLLNRPPTRTHATCHTKRRWCMCLECSCLCAVALVCVATVFAIFVLLAVIYLVLSLPTTATVREGCCCCWRQ